MNELKCFRYSLLHHHLLIIDLLIDKISVWQFKAAQSLQHHSCYKLNNKQEETVHLEQISKLHMSAGCDFYNNITVMWEHVVEHYTHLTEEHVSHTHTHIVKPEAGC